MLLCLLRVNAQRGRLAAVSAELVQSWQILRSLLSTKLARNSHAEPTASACMHRVGSPVLEPTSLEQLSWGGLVALSAETRHLKYATGCCHRSGFLDPGSGDS